MIILLIPHKMAEPKKLGGQENAKVHFCNIVDNAVTGLSEVPVLGARRSFDNKQC